MAAGFCKIQTAAVTEYATALIREGATRATTRAESEGSPSETSMDGTRYILLHHYDAAVH